MPFKDVAHLLNKILDLEEIFGSQQKLCAKLLNRQTGRPISARTLRRYKEISGNMTTRWPRDDIYGQIITLYRYHIKKQMGNKGRKWAGVPGDSA